MPNSQAIDKIFADAISQIAPPSTMTESEGKTMNKQTTVGEDEDLLPPDSADDEEDLDAMLESLTADNMMNSKQNEGVAVAPTIDETATTDDESSFVDDLADEKQLANNLLADDLLNAELPVDDFIGDDDLVTDNLAPDGLLDRHENSADEADNGTESSDLDALLAAATAPEVLAATTDDPTIDDNVNSALSDLGISLDDGLLHNNFSDEKAKLLEHLLHRFEALARKKLQYLPNEQIKLIKSVLLRVEIELKFGEFTTTGDDDSIFQLDF